MPRELHFVILKELLKYSKHLTAAHYNSSFKLLPLRPALALGDSLGVKLYITGMCTKMHLLWEHQT